MDLGIKGKNALVTGASKSLGREISIQLSRGGVNVAIVSRNKINLEKVILKMDNGNHYCAEYDLMKEKSTYKLIEELNKNFGNIDILINNIGGTKYDDFRESYRYNFEIAKELTELVVPYMKESNWGRIINISSKAGLERGGGKISYSCMKSLLNTYTEKKGRELAKYGIVMSAIAPSAFMSDSYKEYIDKNKEEFNVYSSKKLCMNRIANLDEIASMVVFLSSKQASYCIGSIVVMDGELNE